jgi:hypothetical protein
MSRRRRLVRVSVGIAIACAIAAGARPARADMTKVQCLDANAKGQDLRRDGKLTAAREQLRACVDPSCPAMVRDDCAQRLADLEHAQPTIAFEVKDATGADVSAVTVTMDGKPLAERLAGVALPVDVGEHTFAFVVNGQPPVTRTFVLTEGAKGRRERIVLTAAAPPAAAPLVAPAPPPAAPVTPATASTPETVPAPVPAPQPVVEPVPESHRARTQKLLGVVAGGAGLAGIGVGSVFGAMTLSKKSDQETSCASPTACTGHTQALADHSSGMTDSAVATVGFIAGGALLAAGAVLFFTAKPASDPPSATGILLVPSAGPGSAGMLMKGTF